MQKKIETLLFENGQYKSKIDSLNETISDINHENKNLKTSKQMLTEKLNEAIQELKLKSQSMEESEKRIKDWNTSRQESIKEAKAAIFETASKLSNQLLDKHKSETKEAEQRVSKATQQLQEQFEKIIKNVAVLNNEVKSSKDTVEDIKTSLLSPAGAGFLAEVTLENILKASGLEPNRDFIMQYSFSHTSSTERLRPDAIVFLPGNNLLIIDSKASKYFIELANKDKSKTEEKELEAQLKATMNAHLKNLSSKDYKEFLLEHFKDKKLNHISNIMFLPSESAVEKLSQINKNFIQKAWEKDIFPVGPTGLINILSYAKFQIAATKQSENQKLILDEMRKLLTSLVTLYEHAKKVGHNIYLACDNFDKFAASFNSNLLPKAKQLEKLGITLQKNKSIPSSLNRLTVVSSSKVELLEMDTNKK
ncbi:MAG: DNA recombination protein RmuC [Rickettsiales bacterium]|nr:DNA recombination protein RmuC [Rickettsiales bacterium]